VTGQPGIGSHEKIVFLESNTDFSPYLGKSTFLLYLLLHRLENRLPTAVQFGAEYYFIFDKQGAIVHSILDRDSPSPKPERDKAGNWSMYYYRLDKSRNYVKRNYPCRCNISDLPSVPEIAAIA